jgi:hypothetical protein
MSKKPVFLALSIVCLTSFVYFQAKESSDESPPLVVAKSNSPDVGLVTQKSFAIPVSRIRETRRLKIAQKPQPKANSLAKREAKIQDEEALTPQGVEQYQAKEVVPLIIPLPNIWSLEFKNETLAKTVMGCASHEACSPRGRDGVLLLGLSLAMNGRDVSLQQLVGLGSYHDRTPLLVVK